MLQTTDLNTEALKAKLTRELRMWYGLDIAVQRVEPREVDGCRLYGRQDNVDVFVDVVFRLGPDGSPSNLHLLDGDKFVTPDSYSEATAELVARLRNYAECHDGDVDEAADRLERMQRMIDELRAASRYNSSRRATRGIGFGS